MQVERSCCGGPKYRRCVSIQRMGFVSFRRTDWLGILAIRRDQPPEQSK